MPINKDLIPQDENVSHSPPQACPLCSMWALMPYAKRWSTPTTIVDTESALVIGYWIGLHHHNLDDLCKRHFSFIIELNQREVPILLPHAPAPQPQPQPVINPNPNPTPTYTPGITPFTNENVIPQQAIPLSPPTPIVTPPQAQPIDPVRFAINSVTNPQPQVDVVQLAIDAAKMPAVEGKRMTYCPICRKEVAIGEVHACGQ